MNDTKTNGQTLPTNVGWNGTVLAEEGDMDIEIWISMAMISIWTSISISTVDVSIFMVDICHLDQCNRSRISS